MPISKRRWMVAIAAALYLYFLLPASADMLFALYHLTHLDPIYWGYSGFKAAGYYFGIYEYRLLVCILLAAAIVAIPYLFNKLRRS